MAAGDRGGEAYPYAWEEGSPARILPAPIIRAVVEDVLRGAPAGVVSARFHATLIRLFGELADAIGRRHGLRRAALSGGVFQNSRLLAGLTAELERRGFEVYSHRLVPANDGGIALGQAVIAAKQLRLRP
jgi:hydrogenase maturation protein HypF